MGPYQVRMENFPPFQNLINPCKINHLFSLILSEIVQVMLRISVQVRSSTDYQNLLPGMREECTFMTQCDMSNFPLILKTVLQVQNNVLSNTEHNSSDLWSMSNKCAVGLCIQVRSKHVLGICNAMIFHKFR